MIVHTDIYDAFREKFAAAMRMVKAGDPMDPQTDMGPLSSFAQRDTVLKQLDDAKKLGATLLFGGETLEGTGAYLSAGILVDVTLEGTLRRNEIIGPIAMGLRAANITKTQAIPQ